MKQPKQADAQVRPGEPAAAATAPDSRPLKPRPGRRPVTGSRMRAARPRRRPSRPAAASAAHPSGGSGGRQAKPAAGNENAAEALATRGHHASGAYPLQEPHFGDRGGPPAEQYVRLRVRVRGDRMTVLDSHLVDGPLTAPSTLRGAGAYEVTVNDRLVHAAAMPDLGIPQRSFPNPQGPPDQRGHHLTERTTSEFSVRIQEDELTAETIGTVNVRLYRLVEPASACRPERTRCGPKPASWLKPSPS